MKTKNDIWIFYALFYGLCSFFIEGCLLNFEPEPLLPTFHPIVITNITTTSAFIEGDILDNGGAPIEDMGLCWSTSSNPTLMDNVIPGNGNLDSISSPIAGLNTYTRYYIRMYATNKAGTALGARRGFRFSFWIFSPLCT